MERELYPEPESQNLEYKVTAPANNQLVKTAVAFANSFGGKIVIGVDDERRIIGVPEDAAIELLQKLPSAITLSTTPAIVPSIYLKRISDKLVVCLEIGQGKSRPYYLTSEGLVNGTYVRIGSSTLKASGGILEELRWTGTGHESDEFPVHAAEQSDISHQAFVNFLEIRKIGYRGTPSIEELFKSYKLIIKDQNRWVPTTAAILCFCQDPQKFSSESFVICSHFRGTEGREVIASRDCTGTLFEQMLGALAFIESTLNRSFSIQGITRTEELEIPLEAIREIVINAVVHRNYHIPGPIKIAVYENRIEVFSPGGFPGPIRSAYEDRGVTYIRNPIICRLFREAKFIEKLGSGFITVFSQYAKANLPVPSIINGGSFVKCILPRRSRTVETKAEVDLELFSAFSEKNIWSMVELEKRLNTSRSSISRRLNKLIEAGVILRVGKGPSVKYKVV